MKPIGFKLLLSLSIMINVGAIIQMYILPDAISKSIQDAIEIKSDVSKWDSVKTIVAPPLPTFNNGLTYFSGQLIESSCSLKQGWSVDPTKYPPEICDGYISLFSDDNGAKYYIWSKNFVKKLDLDQPQRIEGYFVVDNGTFGRKKEFLQLLYPIIEITNKKITPQ